KHGLAVAPDLLPFGGAVVDLAHLAQHAQPLGQAAVELHRLLCQRQRIELQRTALPDHRPRPPRPPSALAAARLRLTQSLIETTRAPACVGAAGCALRGRGTPAAAAFAGRVAGAFAGADAAPAAVRAPGFFATTDCPAAAAAFAQPRFAAGRAPAAARFGLATAVVAAAFAGLPATGLATDAAAFGMAAAFAACALPPALVPALPATFFGADTLAAPVRPAGLASAEDAGLRVAGLRAAGAAAFLVPVSGDAPAAAALRGRAAGAPVDAALPCAKPAARRSSRTVRSSSATLRCTESTSVRPGNPSSSPRRSTSCCRPLRTRISALVRAA